MDLARLAGCYPAGVLCEIVNKADGSMARTPELRKYAKEHGLKCITIADLIRYRLRHEQVRTCEGLLGLALPQGLGCTVVGTPLMGMLRCLRGPAWLPH